MSTQTKAITLAKFCEASHLNAKLIRAVVNQMGGWESFSESTQDISNHGIDGGFSGFIYYSDTEPFARRNRALIAEMASEQARDLGQGVIEMIRGFGCFRNGTKPTDEEIGSALYAGKDAKDGMPVLNALAWYAGEEVARSYTDMIENLEAESVRPSTPAERWSQVKTLLSHRPVTRPQRFKDMETKNTDKTASVQPVESTQFSYNAEKHGRNTTHYISSKTSTFFFVRRPGQSEDDMRQQGEWICRKLNS